MEECSFDYVSENVNEGYITIEESTAVKCSYLQSGNVTVNLSLEDSKLVNCKFGNSDLTIQKSGLSSTFDGSSFICSNISQRSPDEPGGAIFQECIFRDSKFSSFRMENMVMTRCEFTKISFENIIAVDCELSNNKFQEFVMDSLEVHSMKIVSNDFNDAKFTKTHFHDCDTFKQNNFTNTTFKDVSMDECQVVGNTFHEKISFDVCKIDNSRLNNKYHSIPFTERVTLNLSNIGLEDSKVFAYFLEKGRGRKPNLIGRS